MSDRSLFGFGSVCCVSSLLFLACAAPGFARDACAVYGPDFAPVEGTHSCIRIGGHLRVQFSASSADEHFTESRMAPGAHTAALRSSGSYLAGFAEPAHVRVDTIDESYR